MAFLSRLTTPFAPTHLFCLSRLSLFIRLCKLHSWKYHFFKYCYFQPLFLGPYSGFQVQLISWSSVIQCWFQLRFPVHIVYYTNICKTGPTIKNLLFRTNILLNQLIIRLPQLFNQYLCRGGFDNEISATNPERSALQPKRSKQTLRRKKKRYCLSLLRCLKTRSSTSFSHAPSPPPLISGHSCTLFSPFLCSPIFFCLSSLSLRVVALAIEKNSRDFGLGCWPGLGPVLERRVVETASATDMDVDFRDETLAEKITRWIVIKRAALWAYQNSFGTLYFGFRISSPSGQGEPNLRIVTKPDTAYFLLKGFE